MNIYNHKIHNKKLFITIAAAIIIGMFVIRAILLQTGTIDRLYTLDADELHSALAKYEVTIQNTQSGQTISGGGTILDGRKSSTKDETFTLTIATAEHVVANADSVTVTMPDGTQVEGTVLHLNTDATALNSGSAADSAKTVLPDLAFIQCQWADEIEAYYSRDLLERVEAENAAYALKTNGSSKDLTAGTVKAVDATVDGLGEDLILADIGSENGMSGSGLYGKSGNYIGLIIQGTEDGTAACISADTVVQYMQ